MDGILNLNKPMGWTSHDVVAHVRRLTGIRRVGHAGTLDPMATGVLLVCLGRATRIVEYLVPGRKRYRAVLRLGVSTDSHDADGQVTATAPVTCGRAQVQTALSYFRGSIEQVPPMVSALKRDGQPLYKLARRGITVERAARPIEIHELVLIHWLPPDMTLELVCSAGTYVRALARDLGQHLGCGAHLTALTRLASGGFTLSDAIDLDKFSAAVAGKHKPRAEAPCRPCPRPAREHDEGNRTELEERTPDWYHLVMPMDSGLQHLPACTLAPPDGQRVRHGQSLPAELITAPRNELCRAYVAHDDKNRLLAILRFDHDASLWRPHKVFHPLN